MNQLPELYKSKTSMIMLLMFSERLQLMLDELENAYKAGTLDYYDYSMLKVKLQTLINDCHMLRTKI